MRPRTIRNIVSVDDTITWMDIAALVLVTALFLTAVVWTVIQAGPRYQEYEMVEVVIRPGDTLWGLAREYAPDLDPRKAVYIIRTANGGIDPGRIQPGDVLLIPTEVR